MFFNDKGINMFDLKYGLKNQKVCLINYAQTCIPLISDSAVLYMHILFNVCFNRSIVPSIWNKCIINPIPKSSATDPRDPLSYRGIATGYCGDATT